MNNIYEELVRLYFINKGYKVSRNTLFASSDVLFKDECGKPDFTISKEGHRKIYVEVKTETSPNLSKKQLEFIKKIIEKGENVLAFMISRLGSFLIFEIKKDFKLTLIHKGFFKLKKDAFYLDDNGRINLIDFRFDKQIKLDKHLKKLKRIRDNEEKRSI
jgi:hypothetical protein